MTVVTLSPEQLRALVREELEARAKADNEQPALLDTRQAARALGVCTKTLSALRKRGMPCVFIGDIPKFDVADCIDWLKRNPQKKLSHVAAEPKDSE